MEISVNELLELVKGNDRLVEIKDIDGNVVDSFQQESELDLLAARVMELEQLNLNLDQMIKLRDETIADLRSALRGDGGWSSGGWVKPSEPVILKQAEPVLTSDDLDKLREAGE